jgi:ArsR family transcriptional regulator
LRVEENKNITTIFEKMGYDSCTGAVFFVAQKSSKVSKQAGETRVPCLLNNKQSLHSAMRPQEKHQYEAKAAVLKALAHPTRLWITEQLAQGERCVCEFVDVVEYDFSTISKHLSVLKQAGLVEDERRGKQVFYRLRVPCVLKFMHCIEAVLKVTKGGLEK